MSANLKVVLIVVIGVGACLLSIFSSQIFMEKDHNKQLLLTHIDQVAVRIEDVGLLGKIFIQDADETSWRRISQTMESVRRSLETAQHKAGRWRQKIEALNQSLEDYHLLLTQLYEPAVNLKAQKIALQEIGLTFSREVEEKIIKPYRKEEGLQIYDGKSIDPFKARAKDAAYDLVAFHTKQQLILLELLLSSDLEAYKQKKQHLSTALARHEAQLRYMAVLMGNDPSIQSILDSLDRKLVSLLNHEQAIIDRFEVLTGLDRRLSSAGDALFAASRELSKEITLDTLQASRLNRRLSWSLILGILGGLSILGALLARNIIQFVKELKSAQQKIKESEEKYKTLLDNIPQKIFHKDVNSIYVTCNQNFAQDLKINPDDITGKTDYDFFPKDLAEKYRADDRRIIESGKTEEIVEKYIHNGRHSVIQTLKTPVRDETGNVTGILGIFGDITERIKAEEERILLVTAIEQAAESVIIANRLGIIQYVNPSFERVSGFTQKEIVGKNFRILKSDQHDDVFYRKMYEFISRGNIWAGRITNRMKDGTLREFETRISPVSDNSGKIINFVSVNRDITQEVALEAQLQHAQRMDAIGTLAGGIAHDFNNILSPIVGYTEIAIDDVPEDSSMRKNLEEVLKATERARDLVKQILTFSRQHDQKYKPLKVQSIVKEALKLLRASIPSTIEIRQNIDNECGAVMGDRTQIHQILMNLCTNAYQAMEEKGGSIDVNLISCDINIDEIRDHLTLKPGRYVRLTVSDTGHGILPDVLDRIFEPYYTTRAPGKGTGLGLSVVHGIVNSHGGQITVSSEPGKGTTFDVYLPVVETYEIESETVLPEMLQTGNERILVVDDEKQIVEVIRQILERLGYKVAVRTSSLETLEAFRAQPNKYDLVVSDLTMPNMTGEELAIELMKIRPDIPIILCTGYSEKMSAEKVNALGIKGFLLKPIVKVDLARIVRNVLNNALEQSQ